MMPPDDDDQGIESYINCSCSICTGTYVRVSVSINPFIRITFITSARASYSPSFICKRVVRKDQIFEHFPKGQRETVSSVKKKPESYQLGDGMDLLRIHFPPVQGPLTCEQQKQQVSLDPALIFSP